ncbi:MAG TPA: DUF4331 family protein [Candidatus Baltobacteraceae bacterium]|nr:DUF4331 family protein [Candidatus Baltobacteraceae bacterium]
MKKHILTSLALTSLATGLAACSSNSTPIGPVHPAASYVQFERFGRPAVKELFETFVNHQVTNGVEPYADPTLQNSIVGFTNTFRATANGNFLGGTSASTAGLLYPDEMAADLTQTTPAAYLGLETGGATSPVHSTFGGRAPADDIIDISLGAVFGSTLSALGAVPDDGKENNCLTTDNVAQAPSQASGPTFPYLAAPH